MPGSSRRAIVTHRADPVSDIDRDCGSNLGQDCAALRQTRSDLAPGVGDRPERPIPLNMARRIAERSFVAGALTFARGMAVF